MISSIANHAPAETGEVNIHVTCPICGCERISILDEGAWLGILETTRTDVRNWICEACDANQS